MALAGVSALLAVVGTIEAIRQVRSGGVVVHGEPSIATLAVGDGLALLGLYAVGASWLVRIGRRVGKAGRPGSHLRLPSVVAFMVTPLVLCATNLFANDTGRDALDRPDADFVQYASVACGIRVLLAIITVWLVVAIRRGAERLIVSG